MENCSMLLVKFYLKSLYRAAAAKLQKKRKRLKSVEGGEF